MGRAKTLRQVGCHCWVCEDQGGGGMSSESCGGEDGGQNLQPYKPWKLPLLLSFGILILVCLIIMLSIEKNMVFLFG